MKLYQSGADSESVELDSIDLGILDLLQKNCKQSLATIGEQVGMSGPSVMDRIHKLEEAGVIVGYKALLDARRVGKDVTAFIGVSLSHPRHMEDLEQGMSGLDDVLEVHHVTGEHTLLLKVKTASTASLERLIGWVRSIDGVTRTETMVALSSRREVPTVALDTERKNQKERGRRGGPRTRRSLSRTGASEQERQS